MLVAQYNMAKGAPDSLERLEHMVKEHFSDLMVTMSISKDGCLFLNIWPQPSETFASSGFVMKYLPLFHIVGSMSEDQNVLLKLITFHGKVIDESSNDLSVEEKLNFVKQLEYSQLCQGVKITNTDLQLDIQTFSNLYLVEQFEEKVIIRSRKCKFAVFDNETVCTSCLDIYVGENVDNDLFVDGRKCKRFEDIKVEPDSGQYSTDELEDSSFGYAEDDTTPDAWYSRSLADLKHENQDFHISPYFCDHCDERFAKPDQLLEHGVKTSHKTKQRLKCFLCSAIQANKRVLRSHLCNIHWKLKPYRCKYCTFTSAKKNDVIFRHQCDKKDSQNDKSTDVMVLKDVINQILIQEKRYNIDLGTIDIDTRTMNVDTPAKNSLCDNGFGGSLEKGFKDDTKPISSKYVKLRKKVKISSFGNNKNRKQKKLKNKDKVKCFICGDIVISPKVLRRHIWIHHLKLKPYKCKHCNFLSTSRFQIYRSHYKKYHSDGQVGDISDVEPVVDAVKAIDAFERKHNLNLGPPLNKGIFINRTQIWANNDRHDHFFGTCDNFKTDIDDSYKPNDNFNYQPMDYKSQRLVGQIRTRTKQSAKLECYVCLSSFNNKASFEADQQKHAEHIELIGPFQCPTCYVKFERQKINHHYQSDHPELNAGCCLYCRAIIFRKKLRCHISNVHWAKPQLCNICGKSVSSGGMKDHVEGMLSKNT